MAQTTCFRPRTVLLGVTAIDYVMLGKYAPKTPPKGAWIGSFKPIRQNLYIAISPELLIGRTSDLRTYDERHFVGGPPLPQSKYNMADGRHLENRYDIIFRWWMIRFGVTKFGSRMQNNTPITAKWSISFFKNGSISQPIIKICWRHLVGW